VIYKKNGERILIDNPSKLPEMGEIQKIEEPYIKAQIVTPSEYLGNVMKISKEKRGVLEKTEFLDGKNVILNLMFPFSEILFDFYDKLKSVSKGYASFDYEYDTYKESELVKVDVLISGIPVDALSTIIHKEKAYNWGRNVCEKLRKIIPRQLFEVIIQAAIGSKIIARETIKPLRKDVTARLYGGDITRKRKLLDKQKMGKKRMKKLGKVEVPKEAFLLIYST
jgi:GTP-binding protein LepA